MNIEKWAYRTLAIVNITGLILFAGYETYKWNTIIKKCHVVPERSFAPHQCPKSNHRGQFQTCDEDEDKVRQFNECLEINGLNPL